MAKNESPARRPAGKPVRKQVEEEIKDSTSAPADPSPPGSDRVEQGVRRHPDREPG